MNIEYRILNKFGVPFAHSFEIIRYIHNFITIGEADTIIIHYSFLVEKAFPTSLIARIIRI